MSSYLPPLQTTLSIFNPSYWEYGSGYLTYTTAYQLFLSINGNETIGGLVRFAGGIDTDNIGPIGSGDALSITTTGPINLTSTLFNLNGTSDDTGNRTGLQAGTTSNINYLSIYAGGQDVADFASSFVNINQPLSLYSGSTAIASFSGSQITFNQNVNFTGSITQNGNTLTATPAGSDQQIQINENGTMAGSSNLTYDYTNNILSIGQYANSYQSTNAVNIYGNVNIANQFQPGQTTNATTLYVGNGCLSSTFGGGLNISCSDNNMTIQSGGNITLTTNASSGGHKVYMGGFPFMSGYNSQMLNPAGIYSWNGTVSSGQTAYVNMICSGYVMISFWGGSGAWAFASGVVVGYSYGIILNVSGTNPAISVNNTGNYGQLNLYNNISGSYTAYYSITLFGDGVFDNTT